MLLAAKAGYDPTGLARTLKQYKDNAGDPHAALFTACHPPFEKRIATLSEMTDVPDSGATAKKRVLKNASFYTCLGHLLRFLEATGKARGGSMASHVTNEQRSLTTGWKAPIVTVPQWIKKRASGSV